MTILLLRILLFLLPFVLFFFLLRIYRSRRAGSQDALSKETERRLKFAATLAIIISLGIIAYFVFTSDANRGRDYVPPKTIDGKIEPGHFEDEEEDGGG
jgi:heme/copper-type cytochrome/quinol oxidase subunit 2